MLESEPGDTEPIARFLFSRSHFTALAVKPAAFEVPASAPELSVFRTYALEDADVWRIGVELATGAQPRTLHARADLKVMSAVRLGRITPGAAIGPS